MVFLTAFSIMIRSKKELQDHIFAMLAHIIANFRRSVTILSKIDGFLALA